MAVDKKQRLSRSDLLLSFGAIAFPIHIWTIFNVLYIFPAWLLRYSIGDLVGVVSYPLADAFLESFLIWIGLVILGYVLPKKWLADKFVAVTSAVVWLSSAWAVLGQYNYKSILSWNLLQLILGLLGGILSYCFVYWLVFRWKPLEGWLRKATEVLAVLVYFYVIVDLAGLVVVILRNI